MTFYYFDFVKILTIERSFNFAFSGSQRNGIIFNKEKCHKMTKLVFPFSKKKV